MSETVKTVLIDGGCPVALGDEEARFIYNLLPVGEFYDKRYGRVSITPAKVQQMADNFGKCPAYEVPVKLGHEQGAKSPGKVIAATAKPEGLEVTLLVDADTAQAINAKQYRYMSAEFDEDYHDKKTGEKVGAVLLGAALVNQPAHPYVAPLVLADDVAPDTKQEGNDDNMTELEDLRLQLSDMKAQKAQADAEMKELREQSESTAKKLADLEAQNKSLIEERERAENARNEAEVKAFCDRLIGKGIPPAKIEQLKPVVLSKSSRTIHLSDDPKDDVLTMKFFEDFIDGLPLMPMKQVSSNEAPAVELSDVDKAIERGKAIAASLG